MSKKSKAAEDVIVPEKNKDKKKDTDEKREKKEKKAKKDKKDKAPKSTSPSSAPTSIFGAAPKDVDASLASLFSVNAGPVNVAAARQTRAARPTRPLELPVEEDESTDDEIPSDVANALAARDAVRHDTKKKRKRHAEPEIEDIYLDKLRDEEPSPRTQKKQKTESSTPQADSESADADEEPVENGPEPENDGSDSDSSSGSDDDELPERIQHETEGGLQQQELDKANRTIFIGNLPSSVITDKTSYKTLKKAFKPHGSISSIRFRSIAFSDQIPRKAAFITKALHVDQKTVNAYLVFATPDAARSSLSLNGSVLLSHHIRVDSVAHPSKTDSRRCVFVGNLDFEAAEESLWRHFAPCGAVENVRLVRDAKTNVGKGFAYVQFHDDLAVEKALLLNEQPMSAVEKGKKRNLRITRAKNMKRKTAGTATSTPTFTKSPRGVYVPKPNPKKAGMAGRAGKLFGRAGGAKVKRSAETGAAFEGTRATPGMQTGLKTGGSGKRKGKPRARKTARSAAWKNKPTT
ncbi:hypothetical protein ABW21_db0205938 [Orbilia brochopaga]|nr:hypothetical protein ABW21_db0205938 [Drechslerella brochopaga]